MTKRTKSWVALLLFIAVFGALLVTATFTDLQVSNILTAKALAAHTYYTNETVYGVVLEAVGSSPVYLMLAFSFQILFWQVMRKMKKHPWKEILAILLLVAGTIAYFVLFDDAVKYALQHIGPTAEAFKGGWNRVKLYFMLGLPTETVEDMQGIAELSEKVAEVYYDTVPKEQRHGKVQVTASTSFFVPKPFTPFQWAPMCTKEQFLERASIVNHRMKEMLNKKSIRYNWHEPDLTVLEGVLARGDRKVAAVIEEAYRKGAIYDSWSEYFNNDIWMKAFETCGVDIDFYTTRERSLDEVFPWDFIDAGVTKDFLKREWANAQAETVTPNCRMRCSGCGVRKYGGGVCFEERA